MLTKRLISIAFICGLTSCLWACGSDDDDDTSGTGAASGTGGKGTGGKGTGGKEATGGNGTGGKATGGSNEGGNAGAPAETNEGGNAGAPADTGGSNVGGSAGAPPSTGGMMEVGGGGTGMGGSAAEGGGAGMPMTAAGNGGEMPVGGQGGAPPAQAGSTGMGTAGAAGSTGAMTLEEACAALCASVVDAGCQFSNYCEYSCISNGSLLTGDSLAAYRPMVDCLSSTTGDDWICAEDAPDLSDGPIFVAIPAEGVCDDEVCAFECAEAAGAGTFNSPTLVTRCGC